jgi:hypothetical protein
MFAKALVVAGLLAGFVLKPALAATSSIPTITASGAKFFYSNGTQYFIKGRLPCRSWHSSANAIQELHTN